MARVVNEKEFAARRNEILDVVQRLIYTKGCEQMSIQDILNALKISKGAFYHYFDSKPDLLEALVDRMIDEVLQVVDPIAADPHLNAVEKLRRYFDTAARWKTARKTLLLGLLRSWYADDNLVLRQKVTRRGLERIKPLVAQMIGQGITEGAFTTPYPQQVAEVIIALMLSLSDSIAEQILAVGSGEDGAGKATDMQEIETLVGVYSDALERILGSQPGSLKIVEIDLLKEWLISPDGAAGDGGESRLEQMISPNGVASHPAKPESGPLPLEFGSSGGLQTRREQPLPLPLGLHPSDGIRRLQTAGEQKPVGEVRRLQTAGEQKKEDGL